MTVACFGIVCPLNSKSLVSPCGTPMAAMLPNRSVSWRTASQYGILMRSVFDGNLECPTIVRISSCMRCCISGLCSMNMMNHLRVVAVVSVPATKKVSNPDLQLLVYKIRFGFRKKNIG